MLIGSVFGEMGFAPGLIGRDQMTQEELIRIVEKRFGEHTQSVIQAYAQAYPEEALQT